ncbi:MAG: heme-binding protein [Crocinitomicaceae bacterium]|nr:heme-binding protein [Crocinitomicaceae bacterium]MDG1775883.1 heme-binding protein [Crocinitomicaceae bacterium]
MNRIILAIVLLIMFFLFAQIMVNSSTDKSIKRDYKVLKKFEGFEIRKYPSLYVATTKLSSSGYDGNSSEGFRKVAGFIFGANDKNQKIAMTSPVIMDMKDSVEMSFIMPSSITPKNVPTPSSSAVQLKHREEQVVAILSFGGWANSSKIAIKEKELIALLKENNISFDGDLSYLGYNPPYQVINRKNEISIQVKFEE